MNKKEYRNNMMFATFSGMWWVVGTKEKVAIYTSEGYKVACIEKGSMNLTLSCDNDTLNKLDFSMLVNFATSEEEMNERIKELKLKENAA
jgi:hypothetical protein